MEEENIVTVAATNGNFQLLVTVVGFLDANRSDDDLVLADALTADGADLTVFAPTDTAFANLAVTLGYTGGTDVSSSDDIEALTTFFAVEVGEPTLRAVVEYHVVAGEKDAAAIDALATDGAVLTTLGGGTIDLSNFSLAGGTTTLGDQDLTVVDPNVVIPNVAASNGIIHAIDNVLLPIDVFGDDPQSILDTAVSNGSFQLLTAVVGVLDANAGEGDLMLADALAAPGADLTVFAPTDAAFANLAVTLGYAGGTDVSNPADIGDLATFFVTEVGVPTLRAVVEYHVVGGTKDAAAIDALATDGAVLTTLGGGTIDLSNFSLAGGTTTLGDQDLTVVDPNVVIPNVAASNGIIHAIDNVLLPVDVLGDDPQPLPTLAGTVVELSGESGFDDNGGDFDFLRTAVDAAGLTETLDSADVDLTVFAPTDAAFVGLTEALGFDGEGEEAAFGYLVDALELLNEGNNPIDLLTTVLEYHVSAGTQTLEQVAAAGSVDTLIPGASLTVDGTSLVDADPDIANPSLVATDVFASNGIVHVIDGVLLPADLLQSDGSNDVDFIIGDDGRDWVNTGRDNDYISTKGGRDIIIAGKGDDVVLAGNGRDYVNAGKGDDVVKAGNGKDKVLGGSGNDFIDGGAGSDWLAGGSGDDTIAGGEGNDRLLGGWGDDTFVFEENGGHDTILFFQKGHDQIDLSAYNFDSFDEVKDVMSGRFLKTEIDLGDTDITVFGPFFFGLNEDDFIL